MRDTKNPKVKVVQEEKAYTRMNTTSHYQMLVFVGEPNSRFVCRGFYNFDGLRAKPANHPRAFYRHISECFLRTVVITAVVRE